MVFAGDEGMARAGEPLDGRQPFALSDYGRFAHPSSDHDQQTLCDLSLLIWRLTSVASPPKAFL